MNSTVLPNMNSTLSNNLTFQDVITNPLFYGGIIIFIKLLLCVLYFYIYSKVEKEFLFVI